MTTINPYIAFDGQCAEAFESYRLAFGGEFQAINRYSEMPTDMSEADGKLVMHVSLPIGDGQVLLGSDRPPGTGLGTSGDRVAISISPDDAEQGRRIFATLSAGGMVTMPYERQFWGADHGMCTDRFGIPWMVNYQPPT
jgi:PhnB protein